MESYVDASSLRHESPYEDYPTPSASSDADTTINLDDVKAEPQKKKRKAWGQPVPEIVPILPPRKRAKTAEEKEQRKNERILRNRRAADKSRQRQKAAQADLEQENIDLKSENAQLKEFLRSHGLLDGFSFEAPSPSIDTPIKSETQIHEPVFSEPTPPASVAESPFIAPQLDMGKVTFPTVPLPESGMTQYPAVVLCDLQCQPVLEKKLRLLEASSLVNTLLTLIHYLIVAMTSSTQSTSMLLSIHKLFQTLEAALATTTSQLERIVLNNFQLLHILISVPSTPTQPAIFRIRLLSRLLACNPSLAPLLTMAADKALQQRLTDESWTANADSRWAVASLMTIKWSIQWLSNEHLNVRMRLRSNNKIEDDQGNNGVDVGAVQRHLRLYDELDPSPRIRIVSPKNELSSSVASIVEAH